MSSTIATVISGEIVYSLVKSEKDTLSYFGGPGYDAVIAGPRYGPRRLHHLLTLNHAEFGMGGIQFGFKVSFYYGICFEGCELEWRRTATAAIQITSMTPRKSAKGYPYFGYPDVLPYWPLEIAARNELSSEDRENLTYKLGREFDPEHVYVTVYSAPTLGISLFEPGSDVDIFFDYDPGQGTVRAMNRIG